MEMYACLLGGAALVLSGIGLSRLAPPDWAADVDPAFDERRSIARWSVFQSRVRRFNNILLVMIGAGIAASGLIPHGNAWLVLWFAILVALLVCILLAFLDALSSLAGYRQAVPEAARRSFSRAPATLPNPPQS
jgi:uncharacterized membrane protein